MVFILSEDFDISTDRVIDWLDYQKKEFIRVNFSDIVHIQYLSIEKDGYDFELIIDGHDKYKSVKYSSITSCWYRKGGINLGKICTEAIISTDLKKHLTGYFNDESLALAEFLLFLLKRKPGLGNYSLNELNKLIHLSFAIECGLIVPSTVIVGDALKLKEFYAISENKIIAKNIQDIFVSFLDGYSVSNFTEKVSMELVKKMPPMFFPSLVQRQIPKLFELRIFFINNDFYPMAIFSQEHQTSETDFRKGDMSALRCVPFNLPICELEKLRRFIILADLNTGSIDMIVTPENEFIFLEINPCGQFGFLTNTCNYYLEREIAQILT